MDRRDFLKAMGAGICLAASADAGGAAGEHPKHPNIVLCMADDQGWGDMAYNGHPVLKTPNFDAMAAEGLRFDRFYAAAPVCSPTRGSVMTGRTPNRYACFSWGHPLRPQEITIAQALKEAGYVTGHFGKWHLGSVCKGTSTNPGAFGFDEWISSPNFFDNDPILSREGVAVQMKGESSMVTADAAIEFIKEHANKPKPFLAVVWFGSPHVPHQAAEQDAALYKDQPSRLQNYYGEITGMDRALGKLRSTLKSLGIKDDTILWYCSDNGGVSNASKTGGRGQKGDIYEGGLRVPAILEWPKRVPKPWTTDFPSCTSDFFPTLLEAAGIKASNRRPLDGTSLLPLIDRKTTKRTKPMGFWQYPERGVGTPSAEWMSRLLELQKSGQEETAPRALFVDAAKITKAYPADSLPGHAAWLDWPWKLHRIEDDAHQVTVELYNLADDPEEESDLASKQPDRVRSMRDHLEKWQKSVVSSLNGKDYPGADHA